jgi:hypothetical protein
VTDAKLVHVSHRKWFTLLLGGIFLGTAVFATFVFIIPAPTGQLESLNPALLFIYAMFFILYAAGFYSIWAFLKSRRIEFYDAFVRIFDLWGAGSLDVPYSRIKLGDLKVRAIRGAIAYHFRLSIGNGRGSSWDIGDAKVKGTESDLYSWVSDKIARL